jgi:hypothetical protein
VQLAEDRAVELPYKPGAHGWHVALPSGVYVPVPHRTWVADVEPAGQAYPAAQGPEQEEVVSPN